MIDKLDSRRAQVYIESLIVEVSADNAAEFGIQWQLLGASGDWNIVVGGTNLGAPATCSSSTNRRRRQRHADDRLAGPQRRPGAATHRHRTTSRCSPACCETEADANIKATPNLLTLDNEEARIIIGQNVPFVTGQFTDTGARRLANPFQTIERKDVGITLRVRPQIGENGSVRMTIFQEASSSQPTPRRHLERRPDHQQALDRIERDGRRRPDRRPRRPDRGRATPTTSRRCRCSATFPTSARCSAPRPATARRPT